MKILIADDDRQIIRALRVTLGARGYEIITAADGAEALSQAIAHHPDLIMLDLGMPHLDGVQVIEGLRGWSQVPILVVSGRSGASDKVQALDAGADDYVTKPFQIEELLARIRALTRRLPTASTDGATDEAIVTFGDVRVDFSARSITRTVAGAAADVRLTPTEWRMLEILVRNRGRLVTRENLLTEIWGGHHSKDTGYLRLYLAQLRKKLEPVPAEPRYLMTVAGMGYRFVGDGDRDGDGAGDAS